MSKMLGFTMEYFSKGNTVYRSFNGNPDPLEILKVGGTILNVSVNSSESLMALCVSEYGGVEVSIYAFRRSKQSSQVSLYKTNFEPIKIGKETVQDMFWNPIAFLDAGLVVLTNFSLYSIYCPPSLKVYTHIEKINIEGNYGLSINAKKITMGSNKSQFGSITGYVSTVDGDIYKLSRLTPHVIALTSEQLRVISKFDPSFFSIFKRRQDSWCDLRQSKVHVFEREVVGKYVELKLTVKNPLKLEPYPDQFYNDDFYDLRAGSFGLGTDVIVQSTTKHIIFWGLLEPNAHSLRLLDYVEFEGADKLSITDIQENSVTVFDAKSKKSFVIICDSQFAKPSKVVEANDAITGNAAAINNTDESELQQTHPVSSSTKLLIDPDFVAKINERLDKNVHILPSKVPSSEIAGNAESLVELHDVATNYQQWSVNLIKLLTELRSHRSAQRQEITNQYTEAIRLNEMKTSVALKQNENNQRADKIIKRQEELVSKLKEVRSSVIKLSQKRSIASPELSAKESELIKDIQTNEQSRIDKLNESITKLSDLLNHAKSLPSWYMLGNTEEEPTPSISSEEQQELKILLAKQSKQIKDLELLTI